MIDRPSHGPDVVIRAARAEEAAFLTGLALRSKAHWGYDDTFMAACAGELTLTADMVSERPTYVAEVAATIAGFYSLARLSESDVELAHLFVEPGVIGRGVGRRLVDHARSTAAGFGYRAMIIQGDPNAELFYRAMGGELIGTKPSASIAGRELPLFRIDLGSSSPGT